jgi:hypothetical protein
MQHRQLGSASSRVALALVLSSTATAAIAAEQPAATGNQVDEPALLAPVIVTAPRGSLRGAAADRVVSASSIPLYGVGTIGELVGELAAEDGENAPVVILNGERIDDFSGVSDLPVEAVERVDILPRGAGARVGESSQGRVINVVLRREATISVAEGGYRVATDGGFSEVSGELTRTRIKGPNRYNAALRVGGENALFESERDVIQPTRDNIYGIRGTVVPDTLTAPLEIDPALSAAAGRPVVRAAISPTVERPPLSAFVKTAGAADEINLGEFRTLRPQRTGSRLSISAVQRLAPWLTGSLSARLSRSESASLNGVAAGLFSLPADNAFTPFSGPVGITAARRRPLESRQESSTVSLSGNLTAAYEDWRFSLLAGVSHSDRDRLTEQHSAAQVSTPVVLGDPTYNPFAGKLGDLLLVGTETSLAATQANTLLFTGSGSPVELPAGPLQLTLNGRIDHSSLESRTNFGGKTIDRDFTRTARNASVVIAIPLASRREDFLSPLGEIYGNLEYGIEQVEEAGTLRRYSAGLDWEPVDRLRLSTRIDEVVASPDIESLADPIVLTPGVRFFDFLTGRTVEVTQISGGNSSLRPQTETSSRYSANLEVWRRINLNLSNEYQAIQTTDLISSLPPASAAVLLAFPERFMRAADGTLTSVDVRPVNFDRQTQEQLRSGVSFSLPLRVSSLRRRGATPVIQDEGSPIRLQVTANHTVILDSEIVIRPGLPSVDLLSGGAVSISGGLPRHRADISVAVSAPGFGIRATGAYQGGSVLEVRQGETVDVLRFDPLSTINVIAFAQASRVLPKLQLLKGVQLTMTVVNVANQRQRVTDPLGQTPLNFQPAYRDAVGRTVELSVRRSF